MKTLKLVLEKDREEVRVENIERAEERLNDLVAYAEGDAIVARYKLVDVRSWHVEPTA